MLSNNLTSSGHLKLKVDVNIINQIWFINIFVKILEIFFLALAPFNVDLIRRTKAIIAPTIIKDSLIILAFLSGHKAHSKLFFLEYPFSHFVHIIPEQPDKHSPIGLFFGEIIPKQAYSYGHLRNVSVVEFFLQQPGLGPISFPPKHKETSDQQVQQLPGSVMLFRE